MSIAKHLYFHNTTTTTLNPMMECLTLALYFAEPLSVISPLETFLLCHQHIPYYRPFTLSFDACYGRLSHSKGLHTLGPKKLDKKRTISCENTMMKISCLRYPLSWSPYPSDTHANKSRSKYCFFWQFSREIHLTLCSNNIL